MRDAGAGEKLGGRVVRRVEGGMVMLVAGLVLFLGVHVFSTLRGPRGARDWVIRRAGEGPYKGLYSVVAAVGLGLIVWGYGRARGAGVVWSPPLWTHWITVVLTWGAFVAFAGSGKQAGRIKGWVRHPMLVGVMLWAAGHLAANGDVGSVVLFGSFLGWAVYDRIAVDLRGDPGAVGSARFTRADAVAVGGGSVAYAAMILLHPVLIGVRVVLG